MDVGVGEAVAPHEQRTGRDQHDHDEMPPALASMSKTLRFIVFSPCSDPSLRGDLNPIRLARGRRAEGPCRGSLVPSGLVGRDWSHGPDQLGKKVPIVRSATAHYGVMTMYVELLSASSPLDGRADGPDCSATPDPVGMPSSPRDVRRPQQRRPAGGRDRLRPCPDPSLRAPRHRGGPRAFMFPADERVRIEAAAASGRSISTPEPEGPT